ncbi:type I glyceraldehyde-3-phosphate dehydrogenase [Anaplasma bovis]|uniref:type I glyceraldehyde-3-phosphate dehydrogenase n=1 Tax=Anaplasma bovis TaxID=186733 RepID=UPI002FF1A031
MLRIGINGLGRIGRCVFRILFEENSKFRVVAVNGVSDVELSRHLIKNDSVHGRWDRAIESSGDKALKVGDVEVKVFNEKNPADIPWGECGVDVVIECTGKFNKKGLSEKHLRDSVKKVVVSAPVTDADIQVIYGINDGDIKQEHNVISIGSCTTNCAAHAVKIINDKFGIKNGFITTVHAYTKDQNHVDGSHKDFRRARACGLSMIPTSTGASKALEYLFKDLKGKISASSIRVPTPNVSLVDFACCVLKSTTVDEVNSEISHKCRNQENVLLSSFEPLVSCDFNHTIQSAVFDLSETYVTDGNLVRILAWYDNEWAFSQRMVDVTKRVSEVMNFF